MTGGGGRKIRAESAAPPARAPAPRAQPGTLLGGLAVFTTALGLRLLFWQATPDAEWPHSAWLKADALVWLEYASALQQGRPFELGLPLRPPGTAYLVALLWNGAPSGVVALKLAWALLGSLTALLVYVAAARSFGSAVASLAGFGAAASTGLTILSTSLESETPYLLLVLAALCLNEDLLRLPRLATLALWSALQGLACLFRVEHVLAYALLLVFFAARWRRAPAAGERPLPPAGRALARVCASLAVFALTLLPWHVTAWRAIARFNRGAAASPPAVESALRQVELRLRDMAWDVTAQERRERLPAFARRAAAGFVAATVAHRGRRQVRAEDFAVLEEAFGYEPRPLFPFPFVSSYGPLNFALANHTMASGGFSRAPLEQPPPLAGGAGRYPPELVGRLPPEDLALAYPPHLELLNDGYGIGWRWIRGHPGQALRLAGRKLRQFWAGASLGLTGENLPFGLSGIRRAVDLVVPEGGWRVGAWRALVLAVCLLGAVARGTSAALHPWLLFLASKAAVALLFFGYARLGATTIPVLSLLAALAAERWLLSRLPLAGRRASALGVCGLALVMGMEAARWWRPPAVLIDGRRVEAADPFPPDAHRDRRVEVEGWARRWLLR